MKKTLSFIPLGIGISAAIIYVFSIIQFRIIGDASTLMQILSRLKVYLYISILGFVAYFFIKVLLKLDDKKRIVKVSNNNDDSAKDETYEPFDNIKEEKKETYTPNYDYVPVYNKEKNNYVAEFKKEEVKQVINEEKQIEVKEEKNSKYCSSCGSLVNSYDKFCSSCGLKLNDKKKKINPILRKVINILEIIIMILIIVFLLNYLIDNKEKVNPDFKFPLKISVTK